MSDDLTPEPRFTHDCDKCVPLGHFDSHDLYYCAQMGLPTVIARWSNSGPDYASGMALSAVDPHLAEARRRARARGLV